MAPVPSPDQFPPYYPALDELRSPPPTRDPSIFGNVEEDGLEFLENFDFERTERTELNPVLVGDSDVESFGEFGIALKLCTHILTTIVSNGIKLDEPGAPVGNTTQDRINLPLELGETLVIYHPHAKRAPEVVPTWQLAAVSKSSRGLKDLLLSDFDSRPPYFPFRSLADFELTEMFVRRDRTDGEINDELDLWRRHASGVGVTLKNAREMHRCLEAAGIEEDLSQVTLSLSF
jgi:hypothetical protein